MYFSRGRSHDTEDTLHRRRLTRTVGPEKSEYFPLRE